MILCIETSGAIGSAALSGPDGQCVELCIATAANAHAEQIPEMAARLMDIAIECGNQIEAVAVNKGPGSYTGLRIGSSLAKGICYGLGVPLIACDGLQLMARKAASAGLSGDYYICMMDARRDEVFYAIYNSSFEVLEPLGSKILSEDVWGDYAGKKVVFCGNAVEKLMTLIPTFANYPAMECEPEASWLCSDAFAQLKQQKLADLAYFEPDYGKAFYTGTISK
jgi:tRNA threonylcarbamoyladenosine biosynthesis protein TsaB